VTDNPGAGVEPRVETVAPGIVAVTADNPGPLTLEGTRTWVMGGHRLAIIDPGPDDDEHLDRVDRVIAGRPVAAVCLTHSHADHGAAADRAGRRWGSVHASAETLRRLGLQGIVLADGDEIVLDEAGGPERLVALATPGHSGDHLAYLCLPGREILTGDLVLGRGSSMVAHPDGSVGAYLASLGRLAALRPSRLLPGHGPVVDEADARLADYAAHRRKRTEQVRAALDRGGRSIEELLAAVYGRLPAGVREAAELSLRAHLKHLEELGYESPASNGGTTDLK
jgi:glyoxylase-like metal-dependent hydrolase (beta-lactamase superfamily II)